MLEDLWADWRLTASAQLALTEKDGYFCAMVLPAQRLPTEVRASDAGRR